jgi:hypothetical protein
MKRYHLDTCRTNVDIDGIPYSFANPMGKNCLMNIEKVIISCFIISTVFGIFIIIGILLEYEPISNRDWKCKMVSDDYYVYKSESKVIEEEFYEPMKDNFEDQEFETFDKSSEKKSPSQPPSYLDSVGMPILQHQNPLRANPNQYELADDEN